jgi:hypothetical protein
VLRKQAGQVLPVRHNRRTADGLHAIHRATRMYGAYDVLGLVDQAG